MEEETEEELTTLDVYLAQKVRRHLLCYKSSNYKGKYSNAKATAD